MKSVKERAGELQGDTWVLENPTPAQREQRDVVSWNIELGTKGRLTDPKHAVLLAELQCFMRVMLTDPDGGARMAVGSVHPSMDSVGELAKFMLDHGATSLASFTSKLSWEYVSYFEEKWEEGGLLVGRPRKATFSSAYRVLNIVRQIYDQRHRMREQGVGYISQAPFSGRTPYDVVTNEIGLQKDGKLKPIPGRVAIATLSEAFKWVTERADDVLALQDFALRAIADLPYAAGNDEIRKFVAEYEFSLDPDTGRPWRPAVTVCTRTTLDGRVVKLSLIQSLRRLILNLVSACTICIQGCTGLRAHELIGLDAAKVKSRLKCIERRRSSDGLMEMFFVEGISAKRSVAKVQWLFGSRPVGTNYTPAPIRAIETLDCLLAPWRSLGRRNSLLVTFSKGKGLPRQAGSIGRFTASSLTSAQKEFAADALARTTEMSSSEIVLEARAIRAHRWRTTFAHFVFSTSPRMLVPLRDHFKHLSEAYTDTGYIGADASLLEDMEGERVQATAELMLQMSLGRPVGAGSVQHLVDRHRDKLAASIEAMSGATSLEKATALVKSQDIRLWDGAYATCFIGILPSGAKCAEKSRLPISLRLAPNFAMRSPDVCAKCRCCLILPDQRDFWQERLEKNRQIVEENVRLGSALTTTSIAGRRVKQCQSILKVLDRIEATDPGGDGRAES
jgi:hypothetical protein